MINEVRKNDLIVKQNLLSNSSRKCTKTWSGEFVCGFLGLIASPYSPVIFPQLVTKAEKVETVLHSRTDIRVKRASHVKP